MSAKLVTENTLLNRYKTFIRGSTDPDIVPISVFKPLTPIQVSELYLMREISVELQKKKDEDIRKAAEAAAEVSIAQEPEKQETPEEKQEEIDQKQE